MKSIIYEKDELQHAAIGHTFTYFWILLFGFSGMVIFNRPDCSSGFSTFFRKYSLVEIP